MLLPMAIALVLLVPSILIAFDITPLTGTSTFSQTIVINLNSNNKEDCHSTSEPQHPVAPAWLGPGHPIQTAVTVGISGISNHKVPVNVSPQSVVNNLLPYDPVI